MRAICCWIKVDNGCVYWGIFIFLNSYSYMIIHFFLYFAHFFLFFLLSIHKCLSTEINVSKRKAKNKNLFTWNNRKKERKFKWIEGENENENENVYLGLCVKIIIISLFKWFRIDYNSSQFIFNFCSMHCIVITFFVWKAIFQNHFSEYLLFSYFV